MLTPDQETIFSKYASDLRDNQQEATIKHYIIRLLMKIKRVQA